MLGLAARQLVHDWQQLYGQAPVLLETFVDSSHYKGMCYREANWLDMGLTAGRGRQDCRAPARRQTGPKRSSAAAG